MRTNNNDNGKDWKTEAIQTQFKNEPNIEIKYKLWLQIVSICEISFDKRKNFSIRPFYWSSQSIAFRVKTDAVIEGSAGYNPIREILF